jgi:hypothetical protein
LAHLSVDATTLPAAIITAVRAVERLATAVTGVASTTWAIAARDGRSYESVRKLPYGQHGPGGFPASLH